MSEILNKFLPPMGHFLVQHFLFLYSLTHTMKSQCAIFKSECLNSKLMCRFHNVDSLDISAIMSGSFNQEF